MEWVSHALPDVQSHPGGVATGMHSQMMPASPLLIHWTFLFAAEHPECHMALSGGPGSVACDIERPGKLQGAVGKCGLHPRPDTHTHLPPPPPHRPPPDPPASPQPRTPAKPSRAPVARSAAPRARRQDRPCRLHILQLNMLRKEFLLWLSRLRTQLASTRMWV